MPSLSRRSFLLGTGTAVAASACAIGSSPDRLRLAIIGCRNRGAQMAKFALQTGLFEIVTFCDCDDAMYDRGVKYLSEAIPATPVPKFEKDFRRVFDDKNVDAVVIATPDHWHAMMTVMALDAGKHVYLEKPASYNIADGKAIVAAARRAPNLVVLTGTQQRSSNHFAEAKAFIKDGGIGTVGFARAWAVHDRGVLEKVPDSPPPHTLDYDMWLGPAPAKPYNQNRVHYFWRFIRDYGTGEMGNWGTHWIDSLLDLLDLDYPVSVTGIGGQYVVKDAKEWHDTQTVLYEFPHLTLLWELRLWSEFNSAEPSIAARIDGENGSIVITRNGWTFYPKDGKPVEHESTNDMEVDHARNFADAIRGVAKPSVTIDDAHKAAILCHLANISADLKRRITFDSETQHITGDPEAAQLESRPYREPWKLV